MTEDRMPVETSIFSKIIEDHLELKRRNAGLDGQMPIDRYKGEDPFDNHPLFKTEEQARLEETIDGSELAVVAHSGPAHAWPGEEHILQASEDRLWSRSRDFDWGD
jgi:hypothetical protein